MTVEIDETDLENRIRGGVFIPHGPTHINEMSPEEAMPIRKTLAVQGSSLKMPVSVGETLEERVTLGAPVSQTASEWIPKLEEHFAQLQQMEEMPSRSSDFPHLAWEALKFGLAKENYLNEKLNRHIDAIQDIQTNISLLLDLSSEISNLKEDESKLSEKAENLLEQLKAKNIDLRKEGQTIEELKRQISSRESGLRSEMQIKFTTEVQRLMQQVESIIQILQNIIRSDAKVKEKANQLQK